MNKSILLCSLLSILTAGAVNAASLTTPTGQELGLSLSKYSLDRSYNGSIAYDDGNGDSYSGSGILDDDQDSTKVGLEYTSSMSFSNDWFFKLNGRLAYSSSSDTTDLNGDARVLIGKDYQIGQYTLSPYSGLGYYYVSTKDDYGVAELTRKTGVGYLPVGLINRIEIDADSLIETTLEYDLIFTGTQKNKFSVTDIGSESDNYDRNTGYGLRLSSMYRLNDVAFGPFINYWNIGKGKLTTNNYSNGSAYLNTSYEEKDTKNLEFGIKASMRF